MAISRISDSTMKPFTYKDVVKNLTGFHAEQHFTYDLASNENNLQIGPLQRWIELRTSKPFAVLKADRFFFSFAAVAFLDEFWRSAGRTARPR